MGKENYIVGCSKHFNQTYKSIKSICLYTHPLFFYFLPFCLFVNSSLQPLSFSLCSPTSGDLEDGGYNSKHGD